MKKKDNFYNFAYKKIYKLFIDLSTDLDVTVDSFRESIDEFVIWLDYEAPDYSGFTGYSGVEISYCTYGGAENNEENFTIEFEPEYLFLKDKIISFLKKLKKEGAPISIYEPVYKTDKHGYRQLIKYKKINE